MTSRQRPDVAWPSSASTNVAVQSRRGCSRRREARSSTSTAPGSLHCRCPRCPTPSSGCRPLIAWTTLLLGRLRAVERDVAPEPEDRDAVGDLEDVVQVVRDEHDGETLVGKAPHELEHLFRLGHAECAAVGSSRMTTRSSTSRPARSRPTAAGPRRGSRPSAGRLDRRHPQALQRLGRLRLHRRLLQRPKQVVDLTAEVHVLDDVEVVAEARSW